MSWPLPEDMTEEALEARAVSASTALAEIRRDGRSPTGRRSIASCAGKGVTLQLLWEEHRAAHPNGYNAYSLLRNKSTAPGRQRLSPTMRQTHVAGERMFVDYAGTTLEVIDAPDRRGARSAQLFVAALGASSLTFAGATWTQTLARLDRIAHSRFRVHRRRERRWRSPTTSSPASSRRASATPAVNRSYAEMAAHYDTAIVPARPYKPRDKAKVEVGCSGGDALDRRQAAECASSSRSPS